MVSRVKKAEAIKKQQQQQQQQLELKGKAVKLQCNKGKRSKFKRSGFSGEEDATSSAILLLACLACFPSPP
ncbi:hypothetical protein H6P81_012073 [Aristolochia fimbriata]|uniref:Uncharacterized protein n=1 Tax=Aristolochia fimbriata TaxID=158543 RepID=A0AAV7ECW7_ARIFI|nr:hypothetical protein H6P81_012073 [Aristolochia fimbriata]